MSDRNYILGCATALIAIAILVGFKHQLDIPTVVLWMLYILGVFLAISGVTVWFNRQRE